METNLTDALLSLEHLSFVMVLAFCAVEFDPKRKMGFLFLSL